MEHVRAPIGAELAAAGALLDVGRANDARRRVVAVVASEPDNVDALLLLARCCIELDEPEAALDAATSAAGIDPTRPEAHTLRASALLPLDRAEEALAAADMALAGNVDKPSAHLVRALALFNTFRQREAWAALDETTRLAPDWAEAHAIQGTMHHTFGRHRKAMRAYQRALALQPEHAGALEGLAQLALRRGRTVSALKQFGAAAALAPPGPAGPAGPVGPVGPQRPTGSGGPQQARAPRGHSASAGVDRALTNLCGLALLTAWLSAATLAVAGRYWVAWPIAVGVVSPYVVWVRFVRRRLADHLWFVVRIRVGSDPRLRARLVLAATTLLAGATVGLVAAIRHADTALVGVFGAVGWFLVVAAVAVLVDVHHTRQRVAAGEDALAGLAPDEHANVQVGRLVLRWLRATALLALLPAFQAAELADRPASQAAELANHPAFQAAELANHPAFQAASPADRLAVRAITGVVVIGLLLAYYRWTRRRWQRRPGRPVGRALAHLIPIAFLLVGVLWLVIPITAFWPGQPPTIFTVIGLLLGTLTIAFLTIWLPIRGVRRVVRTITTP